MEVLLNMERKVIAFRELRRMMPDAIDKLPRPAEFRYKKRGKLVREQQNWVGFGWVFEGKADGSEPLLVVDDPEHIPEV